MNVSRCALTISATKPKGQPATMLAEMGIGITAIPEDEGNVDRYVLSERLAIERRTGSSFLRGIMDKTLFTSAIYLREHFPIAVLIVEGDVNYEYTMFDPQAVRGALSSMMLLYAMNVLSTPNVEETVQLIAMMARQEQVGIPQISLIPKRKAADLADMQRRVVEMLPGCGMVAARDLLREFGSVRRIANAARDELRAVRGIGAAKAARMHEVLNADYESVDTERDMEDAVQAEPGLLFRRPGTLLARQHYVYTEEGERQFVDLVFVSAKADRITLVELKRGKLTREHAAQLRRYLDHAHESPLLRSLLDKGARPRGVLATLEPCQFDPKDPDISVRVVRKERVIRVLKQLRDQRRAEEVEVRRPAAAEEGGT